MDKLDILQYAMITIYKHLMTFSYDKSFTNITFNIDKIRDWIIRNYPINELSDELYILPEPYTKLFNLKNEDILNDIYTTINTYFKSTAFGITNNNTDIYKDLYDNFIMFNINPIVWFSITQYQILQIVNINKTNLSIEKK